MVHVIYFKIKRLILMIHIFFSIKIKIARLGIFVLQNSLKERAFALGKQMQFELGPLSFEL